MTAKKSAGLLVYRCVNSGVIQVLLVHPGGPFWSGRDERAWSIPKGEYASGEQPREVAEREFVEELGLEPPEGSRLELGEIRQPSSKLVLAWAIEGNMDLGELVSNAFTMEWPKGSGKSQEFPEVDEAQWFDVAVARSKLHKGQVGFLDRLLEILAEQGRSVHEGTVPKQGGLFGEDD